MHVGWNHKWPEKHIRDILTLQKQSFAEDNVLECTSLLCRNAYFSFDFVHRNSTPEERTNVLCGACGSPVPTSFIPLLRHLVS
jgi:hypothetical protein